MNVNFAGVLLNFLKITILLLIVTVSIFITQNSALIDHPLIASAVTCDLIITLPLAYWFFIRKTKISNQTVTAFITFGFIIASLILPEGIYGRKKNFKTIFLSVDEPEIFMSEIEKQGE